MTAVATEPRLPLPLRLAASPVDPNVTGRANTPVPVGDDEPRLRTPRDAIPRGRDYERSVAVTWRTPLAKDAPTVDAELDGWS